MRNSWTGTDPTAAVPEDVDALVRTVEEERQRVLRLRADFDNLRRRTSREQEAAGREGRRAALLPLLPVLDSLDRALAAGSTDDVFYAGVASTRRLLVNALREAGAVPVEAEGQPFDPAVHEAVGTEPAARGALPGIVVREVRPGWRLDNELLRPAQVVVSAADSDGGTDTQVL
jgi:molecular chaperone GrpE